MFKQTTIIKFNDLAKTIDYCTHSVSGQPLITMHLLQYFLFLLTVGSIFAQNGRKLVFTNVTFSADQNTCNFSLWLNESRFSLAGLNQGNVSGVTFVMKLFVSTGGEFVPFFTKHVDLCEILENPISDPFMGLIYQTVQQNKSNKIMRKCPIVKVSI